MEQRRSVEIAIIGAGVIGLACAVRLASQGREVLLIDPREPGTACSYGNAGAIAPYGCVPVGNPGVLRDLPKLLSAAESPLALRWSGVVSVLPWLLRFLRQSLPRPARANALALSHLLGDAVPAWRELAAQAQLDDLLRHEGCLYVYRNSVPKADWGDALRTELGIRQQHVSPGEVASLEPALPPVAVRVVREVEARAAVLQSKGSELSSADVLTPRRPRPSVEVRSRRSLDHAHQDRG